MRVSIVGSNRRLKSAVEEQEFRDYCHELGKLLVAEGCKVVINSDGKHTADYHVLMGMEQAQTSTEVTVYRRVRNDRTQPGRVEPIKMFPSPGLLKFVNIVVKGERNLNAAAYAASLSVILCAGHNQRQGGVLCQAEPNNWTAPSRSCPRSPRSWSLSS